MEEEAFEKVIKCVNTIKSIIDTKGSIRITDIESYSNKCNSKITRILDMLEIYNYKIDYNKGIVTK